MSLANSFFIPLACISTVLLLIPFPSHCKALNSGTCLFAFWAALTTIVLLVNSIMWYGSTRAFADEWCDVSTRIIVGSIAAIPTASLLISVNLYHALRRRTEMSIAEKRRSMFIGMVAGFIVPIVHTTSQFLTQDRRFHIFEDLGCLPAMSHGPMGYFLLLFMPLLILAGSCVYLTLCITTLMRQSKPDSLRSYHLRQAIMACTITTLSIPYTIFILCVNVEALQPPPPPTDPEIPGLDFSQISRIPANVWRSSALTVFLLEGNRWTLLLLMVIFFSLFGLLPETIAHYSAMFRPLKKLWKISFQSKPQPPPKEEFSLAPRGPRVLSYAIPRNPNMAVYSDVGGLLKDYQAPPPVPPLPKSEQEPYPHAIITRATFRPSSNDSPVLSGAGVVHLTPSRTGNALPPPKVEAAQADVAPVTPIPQPAIAGLRGPGRREMADTQSISVFDSFLDLGSPTTSTSISQV